MARGNFKVGDEVAITATIRKRVTEDRVSVLIRHITNRIRLWTRHQT
jgi:hypothetical protein